MLEDVALRLEQYRNKLTWRSVQTIVNKALIDSRQDIIQMNRDQLAAGLDAQERNLRPTYLTDRYFNSLKEGNRYANFKKHYIDKPRFAFYQYTPAISPTPNIYLTGYFYSNIVVEKAKLSPDGGLDIAIGNASAITEDIVSKYGAEVLGLTQRHAEYLYEWYIKFNIDAYLEDAL